MMNNYNNLIIFIFAVKTMFRPMNEDNFGVILSNEQIAPDKILFTFNHKF